MTTTKKIRGVEFTINQHGCLIACSDYECLREESHSDLFACGFGGRYFATPEFHDSPARAIVRHA